MCYEHMTSVTRTICTKLQTDSHAAKAITNKSKRLEHEAVRSRRWASLEGYRDHCRTASSCHPLLDGRNKWNCRLSGAGCNPSSDCGRTQWDHQGALIQAAPISLNTKDKQRWSQQLYGTTSADDLGYYADNNIGLERHPGRSKPLC